MPTVHLLCGLPASGKTTLARRLEREIPAVRFTLDEWMLSLSDLTPYDEGYGAAADRVKDVIWQTAESVAAVGVDVVLDWSQWSRSAREAARSRAEGLGADALLHYIEISPETMETRLAARNAGSLPGVHKLELGDARRFAAELFEPPATDEPITVVNEVLTPPTI